MTGPYLAPWDFATPFRVPPNPVVMALIGKQAGDSVPLFTEGNAPLFSHLSPGVRRTLESIPVTTGNVTCMSNAPATGSDIITTWEMGQRAATETVRLSQKETGFNVYPGDAAIMKPGNCLVMESDGRYALYMIRFSSGNHSFLFVGRTTPNHVRNWLTDRRGRYPRKTSGQGWIGLGPELKKEDVRGSLDDHTATAKAIMHRAGVESIDVEVDNTLTGNQDPLWRDGKNKSLVVINFLELQPR